MGHIVLKHDAHPPVRRTVGLSQLVFDQSQNTHISMTILVIGTLVLGLTFKTIGVKRQSYYDLKADACENGANIIMF